MADIYLHGAYANIGKSIAQSATLTGTAPVYVGTAPINLMRGFNNLVNTPIKLSSWIDAQRKVGYSKNWNSFTLCEAISAHFNNPQGNVGPIYIINVLDPREHVKSDETTVSLEFERGKAEIVSETIILDTLALDGLIEDEDYTVTYDFNIGKVIINLNDSSSVTAPVTATYLDVDVNAITAEDIIGISTSEGEYEGLGALSLVYEKYNVVTNLLGAPGWSHMPEVYSALVSASQQINGHWDALVIADLPIVDANDEMVDTISKAAKWQTDNGYVSERSKVCWPKVRGTDGNIYHLSSLTIATMQRVDSENASVPMETPSNKPISITKLYFGKDSKNRGYDQQAANELNMVGISTAVFWAGRWVLWGPHTAAYKHGMNVDPRAIFDTNLRMLMHCTNGFQLEWGTTIDKPMTLAMRDTILVREQQKLDALKSRGALIGNPKIMFIKLENPITNLMNGDFRFDIMTTPTPPAKSLTAVIVYTDAGFKAYYGGAK